MHDLQAIRELNAAAAKRGHDVHTGGATAAQELADQLQRVGKYISYLRAGIPLLSHERAEVADLLAETFGLPDA